MIVNERLGFNAYEVHESFRDHRKLFPRRIDEIPMTLEGESLDIERDELLLLGIQSLSQ